MEQVTQKDRSPNYPALNLKDALDAVRQLKNTNGQAPVPQETLAEFAGHKKMSGPARSKIAGIRQYGLIESAGGGKVRVASRALPLFFHAPTDREYQETLREIALTPPLFSQLFADYAQASEPTIRLHLVRDRKFSEEGAKRLARIFKETLAFANVGASSYNGPGTEADPEKKKREEQASKGDDAAGSQDGGGREGQPKKLETVQGAVTTLDYLLGGVPAKLSFARKPTPRMIQRLLTHLQLLKEDLEDEGEHEGGT